MDTLDWNDEWDKPDYEWPVTVVPDATVVERIGVGVIAHGGRAVKEAHADRGITMDFPNPSFPDTRIRKQVPRGECRRRAQVMVPRESQEPLKACVVCDAMHLWPSVAAALS